jgi:hypothetical protein
MHAAVVCKAVEGRATSGPRSGGTGMGDAEEDMYCTVHTPSAWISYYDVRSMRTHWDEEI